MSLDLILPYKLKGLHSLLLHFCTTVIYRGLNYHVPTDLTKKALSGIASEASVEGLSDLGMDVSASNEQAVKGMVAANR